MASKKKPSKPKKKANKKAKGTVRNKRKVPPKKKRKKKLKPGSVDGRPPKYKTPEEMQNIIDMYYLACKVHQTGMETLLDGLTTKQLLIINDIEDINPTVSGLAYTLGMSTQALRDYQTKDDFLLTVKRAKQRVEMSLEQRLAGNNVTGAIFNLKNNFGWKDKTEQDLRLSNLDTLLEELTNTRKPPSERNS